jgi:hypothetical protein
MLDKRGIGKPSLLFIQEKSSNGFRKAVRQLPPLQVHLKPDYIGGTSHNPPEGLLLIEEADGSWPKPTGQELMALHEAYRTRQTNLRRESRHQLLAAGNADHYRAERRMPRLQRR